MSKRNGTVKSASDTADNLQNMLMYGGLLGGSYKMMQAGHRAGQFARDWEDGVKKLDLPANHKTISSMTPAMADDIARLYTNTSNKALNTPVLGSVTPHNTLNAYQRVKAISEYPTNPLMWFRDRNLGLNGALHHYNTYANSNNPHYAATHQLFDVIKYGNDTPALERLNVNSSSFPKEILDPIKSGKGTIHVRDAASKWLASMDAAGRITNAPHFARLNDTINGAGYMDGKLHELRKQFRGSDYKIPRAILYNKGNDAGTRIRDLEGWYDALGSNAEREKYAPMMQRVRNTYSPTIADYDPKLPAAENIYKKEKANASMRSALYELERTPRSVFNIVSAPNASFSDKITTLDGMAARGSSEAEHGSKVLRSVVTGSGTKGGIGKSILRSGDGYAMLSKRFGRAGKLAGAAGTAAALLGLGSTIYNGMKKQGFVKQASDDEENALQFAFNQLVLNGVGAAEAYIAIKSDPEFFKNAVKDAFNPTKSVGFVFGRSPNIGNGHAAPAENFRRILEGDPRFKEYGIDLHNIESTPEGTRGDKISVRTEVDPATGAKKVVPVYEANPLGRSYNTLINTGMGSASAYNVDNNVGSNSPFTEAELSKPVSKRLAQTMYNVVMDAPSKENRLGATKGDVGPAYGPRVTGYKYEQDPEGKWVQKRTYGYYNDGKVQAIPERIFMSGNGNFITDDNHDLMKEDMRNNRVGDKDMYNIARGSSADPNALFKPVTSFRDRLADRLASRVRKTLGNDNSELAQIIENTLGDTKINKVQVKEGPGTFLLDPDTMRVRKDLLQRVKAISEYNTHNGTAPGMEGFVNPKQPIIERIDTLLADPKVRASMSPRTVSELERSLEHVRNGGELATIVGSGRGDYNEARALSTVESLIRAGKPAEGYHLLSMHGNEFNPTLLNGYSKDQMRQIGETHYNNLQNTAEKAGFGKRLSAVGAVHPELYQMFQMLSSGNQGSTGNLAFSEGLTSGVSDYVPKQWYDIADSQAFTDRQETYKNKLRAITGKPVNDIHAPYVALDTWNAGAIDSVFGEGIFRGQQPSKVVKELPHYTGSDAYTYANKPYQNVRAMARQLYSNYDYDPTYSSYNDAAHKFDAETKRVGRRLLNFDRGTLENRRNAIVASGDAGRLSRFDKAFNYYDKIDRGVEHLTGQNFNTDAVVKDMLKHKGTNLEAVNESLRNIHNAEVAHDNMRDEVFNKVMSNARKSRFRGVGRLGATLAPFALSGYDAYKYFTGN